MILRVNQVWQDSLRCSGPLERCSSATRKPVGEKILHVSESLGSIFRPTFQMSVAALPHAKLMRAIELFWDARCTYRANRTHVWDRAAAFVSELISCRVNRTPPKVGNCSPSKVGKIITSSE